MKKRKYKKPEVSINALKGKTIGEIKKMYKELDIDEKNYKKILRRFK